MVVPSENARLSHRPPFRGCGGGGAAALPRRRPRRRASAAQWKDTRAGVAQAALPDENLGSLLVHAAARYRIGSGGRTAGLARVAHGAIREVGDEGKASEPAAGFQITIQGHPKDQAPDASSRLRPAVPTAMIGGGTWEGAHARHEAAGVRHTARGC